jgi:hypothetical protein
MNFVNIVFLPEEMIRRKHANAPAVPDALEHFQSLRSAPPAVPRNAVALRSNKSRLQPLLCAQLAACDQNPPQYGGIP